jgi:hypothetical protein
MKHLKIPNMPWTSISMDFIVGLPQSGECNTIWVVVDRLTKMAHFIPCKGNITAKALVFMFIKHIFRLHGLPKDIVSDRGSLFTSNFRKYLLSLLNIKPNMSTTFHPQTDGQTECTNSILEQYLRLYLNYQQDDWISLLPLAEFSYNNSIQSSNRHSPFMTNYGFYPRFTFTPQSTNPGIAASSEIFCNNLQELHKNLQELRLAQQQQAAYYNEYHRPTPEYQIGDSIYLSSKNIKTLRLSDKLDYKGIVPFKILAKVGLHAYKLELPTIMKIHPCIPCEFVDAKRKSSSS